MTRLTHLRLGYIPLTDCAPLAVAKTQGFFEAEGLDVDLSREASWANIRDKVAMGALDGAHMLGPLPIAVNLGLSGERTPMIAPMSLNLNGAAVVVSRALAERLRGADAEAMAASPRTARALARTMADRRDAGGAPLVFAVVFPFSAHNYQLRYWLAAAGIDPDRDLRIVSVPPARMNARLAAGDIDGYCVGAPWHAVAAADGVGEVMIHAGAIWGAGPDKVFGLSEAWAQRRPDTLRALLRALIRASAWCDVTANRPGLAGLLTRGGYVDAPEAVVARGLGIGETMASAGPEAIVFHHGAAGFPWRSHAVWFLTQMLRWGQLDPGVDIAAAAEAAYRPELFRLAAADVGAPTPLVDEKVEGLHASVWTLDEASVPIAMAPDRYFDGRRFDAAQPATYAAGFEVGRRR